MANIWIEEHHLNITRGHAIGKTDPQDTDYGTGETGQLFRQLQKEHGRCVSAIYCDHSPENPTVPDNGQDPHRIGWTFQKRQNYTDSNETYLHETWVMLLDGAPEVTVKKQYIDLAAA